MSTIAIVVYCPTCDYFVKTAVQPEKVGSHGCEVCSGPMEVYVAQGSREVIAMHRRENPTGRTSEYRGTIGEVLFPDQGEG